MMNSRTKSRIEKFAATHGCTVEWQALKFGYTRALLICNSYEQYVSVRTAAQKMDGVSCDYSHVHSRIFEGRLYLMPAADKDALDILLAQEKKVCDDWWQRYHLADTNTRKLMACGAVR